MHPIAARVLGLLSLAVPAVVAAEQNLDARANCNADNCYRAILQTTGRYSTRGGTLDCSSFLVTTVTPATSTVYSTLSYTDVDTSSVTFTTPVTVEETATATVTSTSTTVVTPLYITAVKKRAAGTVAPWASSFCGPDVSSRFSSACSCLGVTSTVVSAPTPLTTVYVSVSTTVTAVETVATETSLTTETTATTTTTAQALATQLMCGRSQACSITGQGTFRAACGGQGECVCNILLGAGWNGVCAQCISDGNFCWGNGADSTCCSGYCQSNYCRISLA